MAQRRIRLAALLAFAMLATPALAADPDPELERLRDRLAEKLPDVRRENIRRSQVPGLFEVQLRYLFGYVTADGRFLVAGDLLDLDTGAALSEQRRRTTRLAALSALSSGAIEFSPPPEQLRYTIDVFVDVDCNYCRQMHADVAKINAAGVRLRVLFFPRGGPGSATWNTAVAVSCSANPREALGQALQGREIKRGSAACESPVPKQYAAAIDMGVRGTPIMLLPNGELLTGYLSTEDLLEALQQAQ